LGGVFATIKASSDEAYRRLIAKVLDLYSQALFNPHWGEQLVFAPGGVLSIAMVLQGLNQHEAEATWRPFFDWVSASAGDFEIVSAPRIISEPGRRFWDPATLKTAPGLVLSDDRPDAPADNIFWAGNLEETGRVWYAFQSAWLPQPLLQDDQRGRLVDALLAAAKHWSVSLHFNKGLAGAAPEAIATARDTAMNPAVVDAVALVISGAGGPPAYPDVPGHEPDVAAAQARATKVTAAMDEIRRIAPRAGSYVWETDYFQPHWQEAFWGDNYNRLLAIKRKYDPEGLFFLHHGVGSEDWSADGFTRLH
jgi:FAD/FMN-containing dehydrogenase